MQMTVMDIQSITVIHSHIYLIFLNVFGSIKQGTLQHLAW